jgi:serine/threonine-protein kinase
VYEAGIAGEQVFIVMEYVNGVTLRSYLADERPWREVLDSFLAAGRGLAAAHRAGLVHRDFKPDNVLVGEDGRVRVTDFGLAGTPASDPLTAAAASELSPLLTYSYAMAGTPAYMSPEQHESKPVDARTDMFAFCVALWEALYRERPFPGVALGELRAAVLSGAIREPRAARGVPPWVRAIVARGLRPRREDRFATMDALLDALGRDPAVRRRRALTGAGVAVLGGVAAFGLLRPSTAPACGGAEARLAGVWDDGVRAAVKAKFAASGRSYAGDTYTRVATLLDRYAADWAAMRRDACEATAVRHEQSDALLDLRMACLDRRAGELGALTALWATAADGEAVDRAIPAARKLADLAGCADRAALAAAAPPGAGGRLVDASLRARLDAAHARLRAGRYAEGIPIAASVATEARALASPGILGDALYLQARLEQQTEHAQAAKDHLDAAILAGAQAKDDTLVAQAWTLLVFVDMRLSRLDEALTVSQTASAAVVRAGDAPALRAELALNTSAILRAKGNIAGARELIEKAVAATEHAADPLDRTHALNTLGLAQRDEGRLGEARDTFAKQLALYERELGPDHPSVAGTLNNLATVNHLMGNTAAAIDDLQRALAIWERVLGPDHPNIARALTNLGPDLAEQGRYDEARAAYERALAIKEKRLGPDSIELGTTLNNLGALYYMIDDAPRSRAIQERALAIREKALGPDSEEVAASLLELGDSLQLMDETAPARAAYQRARAIYVKARGPDHPMVATALGAEGWLDIKVGRHDEALAFARRALAIDEKVFAGDHPQIAHILDLMGHALQHLGRHADARAAYERSIAMYERLDGVTALSIADPLTALGECELDMRKPGEALAHLERASALRGDHGGGPVAVAETRFGLARALWDTGGDRHRAVTLATRALDAAHYGTDRASVKAWLASHTP